MKPISNALFIICACMSCYGGHSLSLEDERVYCQTKVVDALSKCRCRLVLCDLTVRVSFLFMPQQEFVFRFCVATTPCRFSYPPPTARSFPSCVNECGFMCAMCSCIICAYGAVSKRVLTLTPKTIKWRNGVLCCGCVHVYTVPGSCN